MGTDPRGELVLWSGREIRLKGLEQFRTYDGLLEGLPTREKNAELLERLVARHTDHPYPGKPLLLGVKEELIDIGRDYPFGTPARLGPTTCIGRFESLASVRPGGDYSGLIIIWFQELFAFPIADEILTELGQLEWDRHAASLEH